MIGKPSRLTLAALTLVCAAVFAACNCAPTLRYLTIAPTSGTIYVSAAPGGGVKAARRLAHPAVQHSRRAAVTPQDITTAVCGSLQFAATGYYSNGSTSDQSTAVTWSSSSTSVATVDNTGLATGVALGFTNIGAMLANITATASPLEVDQLNSITVAPANPNIANGQSQAFTATGNFTLAAGGPPANQDITSQVTWASSNQEVATIDTTGNATSVGQGSTTISATSCDGVIVGQTTLTVGPAAAASLQITPATLTASTGTTVQYTAVILNTDNSTSPLPAGTVLAWTSSSSSATINGTTGLAQAVSAGTATITATATAPTSINGFTGTATLTVQAAAARFAYIANITGGSSSSGTITSFTVNPTSTSAPLTLLANTPAASPQQVLLHPSGDLLYYIDSGGALHSFFINSASGALTATSLPPATASNAPSGSTYVGVIDPTGRYIYVITEETSVIYGFSITHTQPSGGSNDAALTPIPGMTAYTDSTLNGPTWIMTDNSGQFVYVVNSLGNTVSQYAIQSNGSLKPLATPTIPTGNAPLFGTTDTNGHLFVANQGSGGTGQSVSAYAIASTTPNPGELTLIGSGPTPITGATDTINVVVNPNGNFLYVLDFGNGSAAGQVFAYGLTATSGVIGSVIGTAAPTGIAPTGIAVDPTGVLLAVDNSNDGDVSTYNIGTNGGITPTSPATTASGGNTEFITFYTAASGQ